MWIHKWCEFKVTITAGMLSTEGWRLIFLHHRDSTSTNSPNETLPNHRKWGSNAISQKDTFSPKTKYGSPSLSSMFLYVYFSSSFSSHLSNEGSGFHSWVSGCSTLGISCSCLHSLTYRLCQRLLSIINRVLSLWSRSRSSLLEWRIQHSGVEYSRLPEHIHIQMEERFHSKSKRLSQWSRRGYEYNGTTMEYILIYSWAWTHAQPHSVNER